MKEFIEEVGERDDQEEGIYEEKEKAEEMLGTNTRPGRKKMEGWLRW